MTTADLLTSVQYVVDEAGHKKAVQIDVETWEQIVGLFTALETELEEKWSQALTGSSELLVDLADEALAEHRQGKSQPLDLDPL